MRACPNSAGDCSDWFYSIAGKTAPARGEVPIALFHKADAAYFGRLRIPLREERIFAETDRPGSPKVAAVNESFARM